MPYLKWIDDAKLEQVVIDLLKIAKTAKLKARTKFGKNVIDPFGALFEIAGFEIDYSIWIKSEENRQAQKSLQNHIGTFHQNILSHCKGWVDMKNKNVFDIINEDKKILAEIKNKHNTLSGGKKGSLYKDLDELVSIKASKYKGFTAYYVSIIPKSAKRYNIPFTPSLNSRGMTVQKNESIREIDGASFYEIATGDPKALEDLFDVLPAVIAKCSSGKFKVEDAKKLKDFFSAAYA